MSTANRIQLRHLAVITASGEECNAFLQSQLSNDLRELTATRAQLNTFNSPKGRVLAVFQLARLGKNVLMLTTAPIAASVIVELSKYILRMKAEVKLDKSIACFGILGEGANDAIEKLGGKRLENDWLQTSMDGMIAWRVPGKVPRIIVAGAATSVTKAYESLSGLPEGDLHAWRMEDLLAMMPEVLPPTQGKFVAQMLRLDELGAIDYDKGCYTGQEIIARAHYLSQVKRETVLAFTAAKRPMKPGETLKLDEEPVATVVSGAPRPEGGQVLMLVVVGEVPEGTELVATDGIAVSIGLPA